jgi:hypothetical protein
LRRRQLPALLFELLLLALLLFSLNLIGRAAGVGWGLCPGGGSQEWQYQGGNERESAVRGS